MEPDLRIYDNGGATFDRYTSVFPDGSALHIGPTGNVPNGVCMLVEGPWVPWGDEIELDTLPEPVQRAILAEWSTYWKEYEHGY